MNTFNKEYFFILQPDDNRLPFLAPDKDTAAKRYRWKELPAEEHPLVFFDACFEEKKERLPTPINPPPDVLFAGNNLLVCSKIADKLRDLEIPNLAIQPAVYIDCKDERHENYWFLTFTKEIDCWDRKDSTYYDKPVDTEPPLYSIYTFSLDEKVLQQIPLSERRLFKMDGSLDAFIVAHKSIVDIFRSKWTDIVPITDYGINYP